MINYALVAAHEAGAQVLVPKGVKLKEVLISWLMAKHAMLEAGKLKKPAKVEEALAKMRLEQCQAQRGEKGKESCKVMRAVQFVREGLTGLLMKLATLDEEDEETQAAGKVEGQFHSAPQDIVDLPTFE